jgi:hypothetical protein
VTASYGDVLQGYLIKALEKTGNVIDKSVDMVMEQAPILVKEVLQWYFAYNLIQLIMGLVIMLSVFGYWYSQIKLGVAQSKLQHKDRSIYFTSEGHELGRYALNVFMIIPFFVSMFMINLEWLKIWIAPRLWLIEYTSQLIKSVKH